MATKPQNHRWHEWWLWQDPVQPIRMVAGVDGSVNRVDCNNFGDCVTTSGGVSAATLVHCAGAGAHERWG